VPTALDPEGARAAVAAVAAACSGHVGLAARHLGTGQQLSWNPDATIGTASTVKVAIYAEVLRQTRLGAVDLDAPITTRAADLTGGSGVLCVLRPGLECTIADLCTLMIVLSDNTATNMLIDLLGGVDAVNRGIARRGHLPAVPARTLTRCAVPLTGSTTMRTCCAACMTTSSASTGATRAEATTHHDHFDSARAGRMNLSTALAKPSSVLEEVTRRAARCTSGLALPIAMLSPECANISTSLGMSPMVAMARGGMEYLADR
jgi:beta-lactamase class A